MSCHRFLFLFLALTLLACNSDTQDSTDTSTGDTAFADASTTGDTATTPDLSGETITPTCNSKRVASPDFAAALETGLHTAGTFPNALALDGSTLLVVNSGDNAVQKIDLSTGASQADFIDTGDGTNPYDLAVHGDRVYVTNLFEGSITVASLSDGTVLSQTVFPELISPQDILVTDTHILVANTEFVFGSGDTEFGSLAIFTRADTPALVRIIKTTQPNPQFLVASSDTLYVVNSGRLDYDPDTFVATAVGDGGVDAFALASLDTATAPDTNFVLSARGTIGNPALPALSADGKTLYLGSGVAPVLFKIDLEAGQIIRGTEAPITLFETPNANSLTAPFMAANGLLYVLDFNNDALFLFDPSCDQTLGARIEIGTNPDLAEGPLGLVWEADGAALLLYTISSEIGRFQASGLLE